MTRVAAVDIGTNSTRLLIADVATDGTLRTVDRRLTITRLGQGVDGSGRLAPEAIDRVLTAVRGYAAAWQAAGATTVGIIATSATRDAANGTDLTDALRDIAGVAPRVLTGEEEAAMAFRGAASGLPDLPRPMVVLDIGGGSTELIIGDRTVDRSTSRDIGSVRLTERVLVSSPPTAVQVREARRIVGVELDAADTAVRPGAVRSLVGVAGTVTTLAAIHAGLSRWTDGAVHGRSLTAADVEGLTTRLLGMTAEQIGGLGGVQAGREDVLAAGALILHEVMVRFGFDHCVVSEADVLDGLALDLLADG